MKKTVLLSSLLLLFGISVSTVCAVELTLLGPKQFMRSTGQPNVFDEHFAGVSGEGKLIIKNGKENGKNRISSTVLFMNGKQILGPKNFNQNVPIIEVPISLLESNSISIELRSNPGGYLTIWIKEEVPISLSAGWAGVGLESPECLLVALPIENNGTMTAQNVQVTSANLASSNLLSPAFPVAVGDIAPNGKGVLEASFKSTGLVSGNQYLLTVVGTYQVGAVTTDFTVNSLITVPNRAPGSAPLRMTTTTSSFISGAPFPPGPGPVDIPEGYNEDERPPIPTGTLRGIMQPNSSESTFSLLPMLPTPVNFPLSPSIRQLNGTDPLVFVESRQYATSNGTWLDPNGATCNDVVIGSYNTAIFLSTDGGANFSGISPKSIFPDKDANGNPIDGGLCCDQVIMYVPKIDRFVWLLQYRRAQLPGDPPKEPSGPNRYRLAVASPQQIIDSQGTAWTYWDLTSGLFGFGNNWMDYPALAVGENYLYFSADVLGGGGLFVGRIPLTDLIPQTDGIIHIGFTNPADSSMAWASHLVQNVSKTAYWAGHNSSSQMRIFSLPEDSDYYSWIDVNIDSWPNKEEDYSSFVSTGDNWLQKSMGSAIIGGTRLSQTHFLENSVVESDVLWLAWTAARGGGFSQPHIELVRIDTFDYSKVAQEHLWNNGVAISFPALAVNSRNEVGVALAFGGGSTHSSFAVGIYGDAVYFFPALADASVGRFGDYFGIRRHWENEGLFSAFGMRFTLNDPAVSTICTTCSLDNNTRCKKDDDCSPSKGTCTQHCSTNLHYVLFGRESAVNPPPPPPPPR